MTGARRRCRLAPCAASLAVVGLLATVRPAAAATSAPDDPYFVQGHQWALAGQPASIDAPQAWCASTGAGILIADVDTGANFAHTDLAGKLVAGPAFLNGTSTESSPTAGPGDIAAVTDGLGHGTMTAGIMAADTNNARGIAAVAPGARVLVVKVLDDSGGGYDSDVANGIRWAADNGARVINVSIGQDISGLGLGLATSLTSQTVDAIAYAAAHNVAVAVAAGNSGLPVSGYLGLQSSALVVGALAPDGSVAPYSNFSYQVSIYAPGGSGATSPDIATQMAQNVVSTTASGPDAYTSEAGTSFATPQVAGTLALLMAQGLTAAQARQRILATAGTDHGVPQLDAARAVGATGTCSGPAAATASPPRSAGSPPPRAVAVTTPGPTAATASTLSSTPSPAAVAAQQGASPSPVASAPPRRRLDTATPARAAPRSNLAAVLVAGGGGLLAAGVPATVFLRRRLGIVRRRR